MFDAIEESSNLIVIQEDGERWGGMLLGSNSETLFKFGYEGKCVVNSGLRVSWYKMQSGKYEIVAYIT
jgi:hypothetical protein